MRYTLDNWIADACAEHGLQEPPRRESVTWVLNVCETQGFDIPVEECKRFILGRGYPSHTVEQLEEQVADIEGDPTM